jgi:CRISPR-associated protein Cmr3
VSVFPPHPPTVVGAVRAALARAMGWPGKTWDKAKLGDGVDWQAGDGALGPLSFAGPYVLRNGEPLFPAPLCLVQGKDCDGGRLVDWLAPGEPIECDLGTARLPAAPRRIGADGFKTAERAWLTLDGMKRALKGEGLDQSHIVKSDEIWQAEARVGVERDLSTRTTKRSEPGDGEPAKGALYAAAHVRPAKDVAFAVEAGGLPDVSVDGKLAPLGGEGRSAWIEQRDEKINLPEAPELESGDDGVLHYTVTLITPADIGEESPGPGDRLAGTGGALPGKVVSACAGRAVAVGGWNGLATRPLPLRPLVPAGSVFFLGGEG